VTRAEFKALPLVARLDVKLQIIRALVECAEQWPEYAKYMPGWRHDHDTASKSPS